MKKRVLVTGGGRGIGLAIAKSLCTAGYTVDIIVKTVESENTVRSWIDAVKPDMRIFRLDLADMLGIQSFIESWSDEIWALVNNAGICKTLCLSEASASDPYEEVIATNLTASYTLTRGLLPWISRPGRIVNIASQLGIEGRAGYGAYCASKFGLIGLTKCWAKELGSSAITVNAVCPGWVSTEMSLKDLERLAQVSGVVVQEYHDEICAPLELKRFNSPEEIASLVCYLLSDEASGITGRDWLMQTVWNQC